MDHRRSDQIHSLQRQIIQNFKTYRDRVCTICSTARLSKHYNRLLKICIRYLKREYYKVSFLKFKDDIRNTWKTINDILHKTKKRKIFPDVFNDGEDKITDKKEIANKFNTFFINIGPNLPNIINYQRNESFSGFLNNQ